jgi:excisionase family DNA binding protein
VDSPPPDDFVDDALPAVLQTKLLFSVTEAARLLSLSRSKVYALVREGRLRHVDIDAAVRITAQDLAAFIRDLRTAS